MKKNLRSNKIGKRATAVLLAVVLCVEPAAVSAAELWTDQSGTEIENQMAAGEIFGDGGLVTEEEKEEETNFWGGEETEGVFLQSEEPDIGQEGGTDGGELPDSDLPADTDFTEAILSESVMSVSGDFTYEEMNGTYIRITGYTGANTEIEVPEMIGEFIVQKIGPAAFAKQDLVSVSLPSTVTEVEEDAFADCGSLTSVVFGDSLVRIHGRAFKNCVFLENLSFPDTLESIESEAFRNCDGITEVVLPDALLELGAYAFADNESLESINYPLSLETAGEGIFAGNEKLTVMEVPQGVLTLAENSFKNCANLQEIHLPDTLKNIGAGAFSGCTGIGAFVLPDSVSTIGESAFSGCTNLTDILLPEDLREIEAWGFRGCTGLTEIVFPAGLAAVGVEAFASCTGLTEVTLPDYVQTLEGGAFSNCTGLTKINYPKSLETAGDGIFKGCGRLKTIQVPESVTELPYGVFKNCTNFRQIFLPDSLKKIGESAFAGCTGLSGITLPKGLKEIGAEAFSSCTGLGEILLPDSVEDLGLMAFAGCTGLFFVNYPASLKSTGSGIYSGCVNFIEMTVPYGVTRIPDYAFSDCTEFTAITLPVTVTEIGENAFENCSQEKLILQGESGSFAQTWADAHGYTFYETDAPQKTTFAGLVVGPEGNGLSGVRVNVYNCSRFQTAFDTMTDELGKWSFENAEAGVTYRIRLEHEDYHITPSVVEYTAQAGENLLEAAAEKKDADFPECPASDFSYEPVSGNNIRITAYNGDETKVTVPAVIDDYTVTEIGEDVFKENTALTAVKIPGGVTVLGDWIFAGCTALRDVRFSGEIREIGWGTFFGCNSLENFEFPGSLRKIGGSAFEGTVLTEAVLPDGLREVGNRAFADCTSLSSVHYPRSLAISGEEVYAGDVNLTFMEVPEGTKSLPEQVFKGCAEFTSVSLPQSLTDIGDSAFDGCSGLTGILLPENLTEIGSWGFAGCMGLAELSLPEGLQSLGMCAIKGCSGLAEMVLPDSVVTIESGAFENCTGLTRVTYPKALKNAGEKIFGGCTSLVSMEVPEGVTALADHVFKNCANFKEILLPESLEKIGESAFDGCDRLTGLCLPEGLKEIGSWGFRGCTGITELVLPDGVTGIGWGAFSDCVNLRKLNYPRSLATVGNGMVSGCTSLSAMEVPEGVTAILDNAFADCRDLRGILLPSTITEIGENAFYNCSGLMHMILPDGVFVIRQGAFHGCTDLAAIWIGENVTEISSDSFDGCSKERLVIHGAAGSYAQAWALENGYIFSEEKMDQKDGMLSGTVADTDGNGIAGVHVTVYDCKRLMNVLETVTDENGEWSYLLTEPGITYRMTFWHKDYRFTPSVLEYTAFNENESFTVTGEKISDDFVQCPETDFNYEIMSGTGIRVTAYNGEETAIAIPAEIDGYRVQEIGDNAFEGIEVLMGVLIPESVTAVGNSAFAGCTSLSRVHFAGKTESIGFSAFEGCVSLEEMEFPGSLKQIEAYAFKNTGLKKAIMPDSLMFMGREAFADCLALFEVHYPMSLETGGERAYEGDVNLTSMEIPEGVKALAESAFKDCTNFTSVTLPQSLNRIGDFAFAGCSGLTEMKLPENLTEIGSWGFSGCSGLTELTLPKSFQSLGMCALIGCTGLMELILPDAVTSIEGSAFANCTNLTKVTYPKGLTTAGEGIFSGCINLVFMEVPEGVTMLPENVFKDCENFREILLPKSLVTIGEYAFYGCTGLEEILLPENLKEVNGWAFANCTNLAGMDLPKGVTVLDGAVFYGCSALAELSYPMSLTESGRDNFTGCESLKKIVVPEGVTIIPDCTFAGAKTLRYVTLPSTLERIGNSAFNGCIGIPAISLNTGLKEIGDQAFYQCEGLSRITVPGTVLRIGSEAFSGCISLDSAILSPGVRSLDSLAFYDNPLLCDVYVPASVTSFGNEIFGKCPKLTLHCPMNSKAAIYAADNNISFVFYDDGTTDTSEVLDSEKSSYVLKTDNALSKGYITGTVKYSVKQELRDKVSDLSIKLRFPEGTQVLPETIKRNHETIVDYTFEEGIYSVPVNAMEGNLTFCLKPEMNKEYSGYAMLAFLKDEEKQTEIISTVSEKLPLLTINTPENVSTKNVSVSGVAPSMSQVTLYLDGKAVGTVTAKKDGRYHGDVTIPNPVDGCVYILTVSALDSEGNELKTTAEVWYMEGEPVLTQFDMYYNNQTQDATDLLHTPQGSVISLTPTDPFTFVVDFENGDSIKNVCVKSTKNGVSKTIDAVWDSAAKKYVATGFFDDDKNYVPGALSVSYNNKKAEKDPAAVAKQVDENTKKLYASVSEDTTVRRETLADGSIYSVAEFGARAQEIIERKELSVMMKSFDKMNNAELSAFFDAYAAYNTYLDVRSDKYYLTVIENFIQDPETGTPGLLILIGDTAGNKVNQYFISDVCTTAELKNFSKVGKAIKTAGKAWQICIDADKMRLAILEGNYTAAQKDALLKEVNDYEFFYSIYNIIAGAAAIGLMMMPGVPAAAMIFYYVMTYLGDELFAMWKEDIDNGEIFRLSWVVDPSGYVYEAVTDNRLSGVKATIYCKGAGGEEILWDADSYSQENPLYTDTNGTYAWDVPEGKWRVKYELEGYEDVVSAWYDVPPAQTEVNMGMISLAQAELLCVNAYDDYAELVFSQYMDPASLSAVTVTDEKGTAVPFTLAYDETKMNEEGMVYADVYKLVYGEGSSAGKTYTINIPETASYNGTKTEAQEFSVTGALLPELFLPTELSVISQETAVLEGRILHYTGKETIVCESTQQPIAKVTEIIQPDETGYFKISVKGKLMGEAALKVAILNTSVSGSVTVIVTKQPEATPVPTVTPQPTATPIPTVTPVPTVTPIPTVTPHPTVTPPVEEHVHSYVTRVTKATLTKNGSIVKKCSGCGKIASQTAISYPKSISLSKTSFVYNKKVQRPSVSVKDASGKTIANTNYTVTYGGGCVNAGTYKVTIAFKGNYSGTVTKPFAIVKGTQKITASDKTLTLGSAAYLKAAGTVGGGKLTYRSASAKTAAISAKGKITPKAVGKVRITITAVETANYKKAVKSVYVTINPKGTALVSAVNTSGRKLLMKWKRSTSVSGYQVSYASNSRFSRGKTITVSGSRTVSKTFSGLTKGRYYYVRVRTYKTVSGKRYYSAWSRTKRVKIRK